MMVSTGLLLIAGATPTVGAHATASSARALNVTDTAHLHYVRETHAMLVDEGTAKGALAGTVRAIFSTGAALRGTFTISTRYGSITGRGSGKLHEGPHNSNGPYASFGGTMTVIHGTGRYAHAHGTGGFYGVLNRETYAVTLQTTGTLSY